MEGRTRAGKTRCRQFRPFPFPFPLPPGLSRPTPPRPFPACSAATWRAAACGYREGRQTHAWKSCTWRAAACGHVGYGRAAEACVEDPHLEGGGVRIYGRAAEARVEGQPRGGGVRLLNERVGVQRRRCHQQQRHAQRARNVLLLLKQESHLALSRCDRSITPQSVTPPGGVTQTSPHSQ